MFAAAQAALKYQMNALIFSGSFAAAQAALK